MGRDLAPYTREAQGLIAKYGVHALRVIQLDALQLDTELMGILRAQLALCTEHLQVRRLWGGWDEGGRWRASRFPGGGLGADTGPSTLL